MKLCLDEGLCIDSLLKWSYLFLWHHTALKITSRLRRLQWLLHSFTSILRNRFFKAVQRVQFPSVFGEGCTNLEAIWKLSFISNTWNNKGVIFQSRILPSWGGSADSVQGRWETSSRYFPLLHSPPSESFFEGVSIVAPRTWVIAKKGQELMNLGDEWISFGFLSWSLPSSRQGVQFHQKKIEGALCPYYGKESGMKSQAPLHPLHFWKEDS